MTEWDNLLMCGFVDESFSVFPLTELMRCHVDSWEAWARRLEAVLPCGHLRLKRVWIGYDPSHTGDAAGLVVLAPPDKPGGNFPRAGATCGSRARTSRARPK